MPTLNEAARIESTLRSVWAMGAVAEVIVVDGGSSDETVRLAEPLATVVHAPRGRARQLNAGAAAATGDVLFFLHADTRPPPDGAAAIRAALADPATVAGAFRLRFDRPSPLLALYGWCTRLPWSRICFGDRGLFVRRTAFERVGGYPDLPLFEDLEIVRRLHALGRFHYDRRTVTTAARRFVEVGLVRQQLINLHLWAHYMAGTDPHRLAHRYRYRYG